MDLAYEILQAEIAKRGAQGIAIVRKGDPPARYFNAYAFLGPDHEFLNTPFGVSLLGRGDKGARLFLVDREFNYDWTELVGALRTRGLNIMHIESWDGP